MMFSINLQRLSRVLKGGLLLVLMLALTACANKRGAGHSSESADQQAGTGDSMRFYGSNMSGEDERAMGKNVYYFGYDQYELTEQDIASINAEAKRLLANPNAKVRIAGHTDERGSRGYNIALGERRAKAIANALMLKGVNPNQLDTVSYGKEKPASLGHDESSWSQNRRGVIGSE